MERVSRGTRHGHAHARSSHACASPGDVKGLARQVVQDAARLFDDHGGSTDVPRVRAWNGGAMGGGGGTVCGEVWR